MYCRYCGAEVESKQNHCRKCGVKQPVESGEDETSASGDNEHAIITKIFIAVCFFLMLIAGLKMMSDDNYTGLIFVILGFGSLIYGLFWWQNRRTTHFQKSETDLTKQLDSEDKKLLATGNEQFSVTEEATRKLESIRVHRN